VIDRVTLRYQPFFCEENAYCLARDPILGARRRWVVFISNPHRSCAMWNQRAAGPRGKALLWDYHVIVLVEDPWEAWDLDTHLPLPCPAIDYLARSFRVGIAEEYMPRFRVIDAPTFAETFSSDRSHMRRRDGTWKREPPPWPMIGAPDRAPNLMRFVDMEAPFLGEVLDLEEMIANVA
jgi:protein N-terminal glutamine amidohydrolase